MSLSFRSEEYYKKFIELQEKLRKSEEERLKLEMKFNEMVQTTREEKQHHYRKLRWKYKQFLQEDRLRQDRNERIGRTLERIESRIVMIQAKTDRCKLLRQQYKKFINRMNEEATNEAEKRLPKATFSKECSEKPIPKDDLVDAYIKNMSSTKLRNYFENQEEKIQERPPESYLYDVPNRPNYTNEIADDIINSLYSPRNKKPVESLKSPLPITPDQSKIEVQPLVNIIPPNENVIENYIKRVDQPRLETFDYDDYQENINLTEQLEKGIDSNRIQLEDEETIEETNLESIQKFDIENEDTASNKQNLITKEHQEKIDQVIEEMSDLKLKSGISLDNSLSDKQKVVVKETMPELSNEPIIKDDIKFEKETVKMEELVPDESVNKLEDKSEEEAFLEQPPETVRLLQDQPSPDQYDESVLSNVEEKLEEKAFSKQPQNIYQDEIQASLDQPYPPDQYEHNQYLAYDENGQIVQQYDQTGQYDENGQLIPQYDEHGQVIQYDANDQQYLPQYNEHDQYVNQYEGQYDENGQLIMQYDETGQPIQQYDETGQSIQHYGETGQPIQQYDETGQPIQQYDETGQLIRQYDETGQVIQHYDEAGQPIQQYDETGQPIQHYDEAGQPIQQYDETGQPIPHYDETGQPIQQYDETGQPIQQYDETGQPIQHYNETRQLVQQYDETGQLTQHYSETGQPIQQYDETGQPIQYYDETGQVSQHYDEMSQPIHHDDHTGVIQQYDETGKIEQYNENVQVIQNSQPISDIKLQYEQYNESESNIDNKIFEPQEEVAQLNIEAVPQTEVEQSCEELQETQQQDTNDHSNVEQNDGLVATPQNGKAEEQNLAMKPEELLQTNVMDMLDTDTESARQDTKVSNDSDFDFSNA